MNIFVELSVIILLATAVSVIMKILRQPFIVGYILTGILVGPYFLNILHSGDSIELFSKIGITILLFIVGLHLNPQVIKEVGKISFITGMGQVIFTSVIGYAISIALGFSPLASAYIAVALTFSSTIIILKLLSDKGDLDKLYGKISIGFLLVQDLVATFILIAITTLAGNSQDLSLQALIALMVFKGSALALGLFLINRFVLPKVGKFFATSAELLFLFSIAWGLGVASIFSLAGFSIEIGALIAGIALSTTAFASEIGSRLKPLRDFFILQFFILLGSQMVLSAIPQIILPALILSVFVLIGNPLIVVVIMNLLGFKRRTGFLAGLTVAQISEFSLILAALGVSVGHLSTESLSLVTMVGLITISGSTYFIIYSDKIYKKFDKFIKLFEIRKIKREKSIHEDIKPKILLFGFDRVGRDYVTAIRKLKKDFLVIDHNPYAIAKLKKLGIPFAYGDAEDVEFLDELGLSGLQLAVSTIPDFDTNKQLAKKIHTTNVKAIFIVISHNVNEAQELYDAGASYVIMPHYLGAEYATKMISKHGLNKTKFNQRKAQHLKALRKRAT